MGQQPFRVLVRFECFDGQSKFTNKFFTENSTIRELKEEITKEYDFNPADVSLLRSGRVLEEEKTLGDYHIKSSACAVTLKRKLRGGDSVVKGSFSKNFEQNYVVSGTYWEYKQRNGRNRGISLHCETSVPRHSASGKTYIYLCKPDPHGSKYNKKQEQFYKDAKDAIMDQVTCTQGKVKFPSTIELKFYKHKYTFKISQ